MTQLRQDRQETLDNLGMILHNDVQVLGMENGFSDSSLSRKGLQRPPGLHMRLPLSSCLVGLKGRIRIRDHSWKEYEPQCFPTQE